MYQVSPDTPQLKKRPAPLTITTVGVEPAPQNIHRHLPYPRWAPSGTRSKLWYGDPSPASTCLDLTCIEALVGVW